MVNISALDRIGAAFDCVDHKIIKTQKTQQTKNLNNLAAAL